MFPENSWPRPLVLHFLQTKLIHINITNLNFASKLKFSKTFAAYYGKKFNMMFHYWDNFRLPPSLCQRVVVAFCLSRF